MTRIQKGKDPERWLLRNRKGVVPASSTSQLFKAEASGVDVDMDTAFANHRTAGGRQYRAVDTGNTDLFGDDEDEDGGRRRNRRGGDGDMDEVDFEEAFEDDEQTMEVDEKEDEEAKELEVSVGSPQCQRLSSHARFHRNASRRSTTLRTRLARATPRNQTKIWTLRTSHLQRPASPCGN
jgi:hypothetical protein